MQALDTSITDNTCTFKPDGKLFSLAYLNKYSSGNFYQANTSDPNTIVLFNFCDPFLPEICANANSTMKKAYSFAIVNDTNQEQILCYRYSSDSKLANFVPQYTSSDDGEIQLNLTLFT